MILTLIFSGCTQKGVENLDTFNLEDMNKDIFLKGRVSIYEEDNHNLYVFDGSNKQFRLDKCSKYNLKIGDIANLQGFVYEDLDNNLIFECSSYEKSLNESQNEYYRILQKIENKSLELENLSSEVSRINIMLEDNKTELKKIMDDINNLADEVILDEIRDEIISRGEGLPPDPTVQDFKSYIVRNSNPDKIEKLDNNYEKEYYHFLYLDNKDYQYYIIGTKKVGAERYDNYTIEPYRFR